MLQRGEEEALVNIPREDDFPFQDDEGGGDYDEGAAAVWIPLREAKNGAMERRLGHLAEKRKMSLVSRSFFSLSVIALSFVSFSFDLLEFSKVGNIPYSSLYF